MIHSDCDVLAGRTQPPFTGLLKCQLVHTPPAPDSHSRPRTSDLPAVLGSDRPLDVAGVAEHGLADAALPDRGVHALAREVLQRVIVLLRTRDLRVRSWA